MSFSDKHWHVCKQEPQDSLETLNARVQKVAKFTPLPAVDAVPIMSYGMKFSQASWIHHICAICLSFFGYLIALNY